MGIVTFKKQDAEELVATGILDGDHWKTAPAGQLIRRTQTPSAVSGSLTFTATTETFELIRQSSAFNALMVLTTMASVLGRPVERTVSLIVNGALNGIFEGQSDLGRTYHEKMLRRALLRTNTAQRSTKPYKPFDDFILRYLKEIPDPVRKLCASSEEEVQTLGIEDSQLGAIAEWAFTASTPRTLLLWNKVESLTAAVVSTFFKYKRLAVVDCDAEKCQLFIVRRILLGCPH